MTERDPRLQGFDVVIGTWTTAATHPLYDGGVVTGRVTYEWLEGGHYLIQRSWNDHELFPDAICVIGAPEDGEGLKLEYFDSRGVRRTYDVSLEDGVLRWWRDCPGFDQRATGRLHPEEWVFQCELAEAPGEWKDDLRAVHRRAEEAGKPGEISLDRGGSAARGRRRLRFPGFPPAGAG